MLPMLNIPATCITTADTSMSRKRSLEDLDDDFGSDVQDVSVSAMASPMSENSWQYVFNLVPLDFLGANLDILRYVVLRFFKIPKKVKKLNATGLTPRELKQAKELVAFLAGKADDYAFLSESKESESCSWTTNDGRPVSDQYDAVQVLGFRSTTNASAPCTLVKNFKDVVEKATMSPDFSLLKSFELNFCNSLSVYRTLTQLPPAKQLEKVRSSTDTWKYAINFMPLDVFKSLAEPIDPEKEDRTAVLDLLVLRVETLSADDFSVLTTDEEKRSAQELVNYVVSDAVWERFADTANPKAHCAWTKNDDGNVLKLGGFRLKPCSKHYGTLGNVKKSPMDAATFAALKAHVKYFTSLKQEKNLAEKIHESVHTFSSVVRTMFQNILQSNNVEFMALFDNVIVNKKFMFPLTLSDCAGRAAFMLLALLMQVKPEAQRFLAKQCQKVLNTPGMFFKGNDEPDTSFPRRDQPYVVTNAFGPQMSCSYQDLDTISKLSDDKQAALDALLDVVDSRTLWFLLKLIRPLFNDAEEHATRIDKLAKQYGRKVFSDIVNTRKEIRRTEDYLSNVVSKKGIVELMKQYLKCDEEDEAAMRKQLVIANVYMRMPYYEGLLTQVTLKICAPLVQAVANPSSTVMDLRSALSECKADLPALQSFARLKQGYQTLTDLARTARFVQDLEVLDALRCCNIYSLDEYVKAVRVLIGARREDTPTQALDVSKVLRCAAANKPYLIALLSTIPSKFFILRDSVNEAIVRVHHPDFVTESAYVPDIFMFDNDSGIPNPDLLPLGFESIDM